jgi:hypothetical protein
LLLADAQFGDAALGVDVDAKVPQQALRRSDNTASIDQHAGDQRLAAEEDVIGHAQVGNEIELLMDDRHAGLFGVAHAAERHARLSTWMAP